MGEHVRCKFRCDSVTKTWNGSKFLYSYVFFPVSSGSEENKQFWEWTPSGRLEFSSVNEMPIEPGKEFYLDLTGAPVAPPK